MSGDQLHKKRNNGSVISNSKAKGILILIGALLVFQVVTFFIGALQREGEPRPEFATGEDVTNWAEKSGGKKTGKHVGKAEGGEDSGLMDSGAQRAFGNKADARLDSFPFDPNTITKDSLVLLGFSPKQAQVVMNYREKGGRFRKKEDFARMYVVSEERYDALKDRIVIRRAVGGASGQSLPESNRIESLNENRQPALRSDAGQRLEAESSRKPWLAKSPSGAADTLYGKKRAQRDSAALRKPWRCDLNRADSATLVKLYGVGPYFARKILRYRERLGGWFVQAEQLLEIEGVEQDRFEGFREKLLVDTTGMRRFLLDTLGRTFMEKHPYIGPYAARGILLYREGHGKGVKLTLGDLVREHILSKEDAGRLEIYIKQ